MNETVASDDDDGEPFVFTETFVAAVVGVCGVLVFCLPLNKLIRWCCLTAGGPKRVVAAENGDAEKDMWDRLDGVYAAAVAEKIPTAIKRLAGSVCIYVAVRMASRHHVSKDYDWIVEDATMVLFPLFFGLLFLLAWVDVFGKYFEKRSRKTRTLLDDQILSFGTNAAKTALVVLAASTTLENLGVDVNAIIATVGVSSLAIALALQDYVKNIVGLFILMTDQPFELNDHVRVAGVEGFVEEIKFRFTTIKDFDGVRHRLPNATFIAGTVANFCKQESTKVKLAWTVSYAAPSEAVHELRESVYAHLKSGAEPSVGAWVDVDVRFASEGIAFALTCYRNEGEALAKTTDPDWGFYHEARHLKERLLLFVKNHMEKQGLEFARLPEGLRVT